MTFEVDDHVLLDGKVRIVRAVRDGECGIGAEDNLTWYAEEELQKAYLECGHLTTSLVTDGGRTYCAECEREAKENRDIHALVIAYQQWIEKHGRGEKSQQAFRERMKEERREA